MRSPQAAELAARLTHDGVTVARPDGDALDVRGTSAELVGTLAARHGLVLHELRLHRASLEDAYLNLTGSAVEYRSHTQNTENAA